MNGALSRQGARLNIIKEYKQERGIMNQMKDISKVIPPPGKEEYLDLIEAAYFEGWKAGAEKGPGDSPAWNASEDYADSNAKEELKRLEDQIS